MKDRWVAFFLGTSMLLVLASWALALTDRRTPDERTYRQMLRVSRTWMQLQLLEGCLPASLIRFIHLSDLKNQYESRREAKIEILLASGHYTNASITIDDFPDTTTNPVAGLAEIQRPLPLHLCPIKEMNDREEGDQLKVRCRALDLPLIWRAVENP